MKCNACDIGFSQLSNFLAHKKYYCRGLQSRSPPPPPLSAPPPPPLSMASGLPPQACSRSSAGGLQEEADFEVKAADQSSPPAETTSELTTRKREASEFQSPETDFNKEIKVSSSTDGVARKPLFTYF